MKGLMQAWPLTVNKLIEHADRVYPATEIVSRRVDGEIVRTTYGDLFGLAKQVSHALSDAGIAKGDRVATLAWNSDLHMAIWYGTMGIGGVLHTLNPRLHPDQIAWIANHAGDRILILDRSFIPIVEQIKSQLGSVETFVVLADEANMPDTGFGAISFEAWTSGRPAEALWGDFPEDSACGLCYTSGTTGDPKGVLYSHRSNVLHSYMALGKDVLGIGAGDTVMPVVPMFHANAWGLAFACPAAGARMVMPGAQMDGASIYELLTKEKVTISAAVPTVWLMLLAHLQEHDLRLPHLRKVVIGGSALPESILRLFEEDYDVEVIQAWGMTETSPLGTLGSLPLHLVNAPLDARVRYKRKQGRPPFGVELRLVDDGGHAVEHDGKSPGRLLVRGAAVAAAYYRRGPCVEEDGFFDTGDVATLDEFCTMQITDRAKDVIKSGGEWISSIDIENIAVGHPKVRNAAAIGLHHPKWDERPLLVIEPAEDDPPTKAEVLAQLDGRIAKWWMPDDVVFVASIPLGATGKIDKRALRAMFKDFSFDVAGGV